MKVIGLLCCLAAFSVGAAETIGGISWRTSRYAKISGTILTVDVPENKAHEGGWGIAEVDLSPYSGKGVIAEIKCRGENISVPTESWNGLKFMFSYTDPETGEKFWPNTNAHLGSFPEQMIRVTDNRSVKRGKARLTLGLQSSSGKVVFDLSSLKIETMPDLYPRVNSDYKVTYPERVRAIPMLRGVMLPGGPCKEDDFKTLHDWGVTLARYQMTRNFSAIGKDRDLVEYDTWLNGKLDHLEKDVLPWAAKYGIKIVVDLHCPPGGREETKDWTMYYDGKYADHFIVCWKRIATRFKGRPEIFGFDLINEPVQTRLATACDYWTIQKRAAEAVRAIDPDTSIIIESNGWDSADTFAYLSPLAMDNVIYQVHMYQPHQFTHQGVHVTTSSYPKYAYPEPKMGWNKEYLRRRLAPVLAFQKKHNARIYVGEFSAITWAEGADRYIADCIDLFEEYGWDWTYHAFREWSGWSVEYEFVGGKNFKPSADNPRRRALLNGFKRGRK